MPVNDREARLEARIRELEDERDRGGGRRRRPFGNYDDLRDDYVSLGERKVDEMSRVLTGAVRAGLEGLRVASESASTFVDDVLERSIPDREETPVDVVRRLPNDVRSGLTGSLDRKLEVPGRKVERFQRTYTVEEGGRPREGRSTRRRGGRRREPVTEDIRRWSRAELYDRAADLGIDDFQRMDREELVEAISSEQRSYEDWTTAALYRRARDLGLDDRPDMDREQLIAELRRRERRAAPARSRVDRERGRTQEGDELDRLSRQDLMDRAEALGVETRSNMSTEQLRNAVRRHKPTLEDMSREELYELARQYDIANRSTMNRDELIAAIHNHEEEHKTEQASA